MQIVVSDPLTEGSFLKKFTTYQVMSHVAVRRRYSDFEWLLTALRSRFVSRVAAFHITITDMRRSLLD